MGDAADELPVSRCDVQQLDEFGRVADELSGVLVSAEDALLKAGFRVDACVSLERGGAKLCWGKHGGRWSLQVVSATSVVADLLHQSLETRMMAVRALPSLVRELEERKLRRIAELREVVSEGRRFVEELLKRGDDG